MSEADHSQPSPVAASSTASGSAVRATATSSNSGGVSRWKLPRSVPIRPPCQPGASSAPTTLVPGRSSPVTSYSWYCTRRVVSVQPGRYSPASRTRCPLTWSSYMPRAVARMTTRGGTSASSIAVRVRYAPCGPSWVLCSPGRIHRAPVPLTVKASVWLNCWHPFGQPGADLAAGSELERAVGDPGHEVAHGEADQHEQRQHGDHVGGEHRAGAGAADALSADELLQPGRDRVLVVVLQDDHRPQVIAPDVDRHQDRAGEDDRPGQRGDHPQQNL